MKASLASQALSASCPPVDDGALPAVLEASGLAVGWGGLPVLRDIHLSVRAGERIALMGPNGSGKTTLLRVLAGLLPPLAGRLQWLGGPLPKGALRCKVAGFVLQAEPPPHFTVRQLLALGLGTDGRPSALEARRVARLLEDEGLVEFADRPCFSLSGGEWQRTAIARALVAEPALLFLDEPTNHLDPARRAVLHERLECLRRQAVVLATHDLELASLCDRVMIFGEQKAIALGRPDEVLTPAILARSLGVRVRRLDDPRGGPSLFRILGSARSLLAAEES